MRLVSSLALVPLGIAVLAPPALAQKALDRVAPVARPEALQPDQPARSKPAVAVDVDAPSGNTAGSAPILVGAVVLVGLEALGPPDFADLLATSVGQTLDGKGLARLATAIAERARARGYMFASAWIEPQRMANGILAIRVDEGRIDEIRFDGPAQPAVLAALQPLIDGKPARLAEVERRLLIAGDLDGVQIQGSKFLRERGKGVLLVKASIDRAALRVVLANDGTRPLGPVQIRIDADLNGILFSDDAFTVTYSMPLLDPRELQFGRARYAKRIGADGTEIALSASGSIARPGSYLQRFDIDSRSWSLEGSILHPLWRRRSQSLWLETEFGLRDLDQRRGDTRVRHDRIATARMTLSGNMRLAGGRLRVSSTLSQGLGVLGATKAGDRLASRPDADGMFTSLNSWADWTAPLGGKFSVRLAVQSQLASDPLLVVEESGLGGTAFLRGYDWSERSGDQSAMATAELHYTLKQPLGLVRRAQLYAFADGGTVRNLAGGYGGGTLASAGGGMRADVTDSLGATFEVAAPLNGPRYDDDSDAPRVNFRLIKSF